jgi:hypothetical protein
MQRGLFPLRSEVSSIFIEGCASGAQITESSVESSWIEGNLLHDKKLGQHATASRLDSLKIF